MLIRCIVVTSLLASFSIGIGCNRSKSDDAGVPTYSSTRTATTASQPYEFCVVPALTPAKIVTRYQPLIDVLSSSFQAANLPTMTLQVARDHSEFIRRLKNKEFSFALVSGVTAVNATSYNYHVIAKLKGDENFCGIVLVPNNSTIHSVEDLLHKRISFPARTVMAGAMMPRMFLHDHGLERDRDYSAIYCESYDSAVLTLSSGRSDAAAVGSASWAQLKIDRPDLADLLSERFRTDSMIQLAIIASPDVDGAALSLLKATLSGLGNTAQGRVALAAQHAEGYEAADDATFLPARKFLANYHRLFGDD